MAQDDVAQDGVPSPVLSVITDLRNRAQILLAELEIFREYLLSIRQDRQVEIAHFRSTVQSELGMLIKLTNKPETDTTIHIARSSNLPFLETIWNTAKKSAHLVSLHKRIYYESPLKSLGQKLHHVSLDSDKGKGSGKKNLSVIVDTITDRGLTWTKISLVTNKRLIFDLAKQGWVSEGSEDEDSGKFPDDDDDDDVPLVKNTRELVLAARSYRTRTKAPAVHLVLPRVEPGKRDEVDEILEQCRAAGAIVFCGEDLKPVPPLEDALHKMVPDPISEFSSTLNIDCTILLALVSEFSHAKVSKEPWFSKDLQRQADQSNEELLDSILFPAIARGPKLVCTKEAAKRMREIVETIGTPSEKARTAILLGDDTSRSQKDLIEDMQQWSISKVLKTWQLPVEVVDQNEGNCQMKLPQEAAAVGENMTSINQSVFLFGWASGYTTITSNRTVVKQLESDLETLDNLDESVWPKIWVCPTARSLVGKEKRGVKKEVEDLPCDDLIAAKTVDRREAEVCSS